MEIGFFGSRRSTIACHLAIAFNVAAQIHPCMHACICAQFHLATAVNRATAFHRFPACCPDPPMHARMHAFLPFSSLPHRSTLDGARYATIASTVHLSHNCGQICDRNCDRNCDANFGPDQLDDKIHFRIISTFCVHGYAQEHTSVRIYVYMAQDILVREWSLKDVVEMAPPLES